MTYVEYGPEAERWAQRFARWADRLRSAHLDGLIGALLDAAEPFGPLGAQMLWVAQPALSVFVPRGEVSALAQLLDAPGGVAWLRAQLDDADPDNGTEL